MKKAVIVGGSNGIGLAISKNLIDRGYFEYIKDRPNFYKINANYVILVVKSAENNYIKLLRQAGYKICSMDIGNSFFVHATKDISGLPIEIIKRDFLYNNDEMALLIKKFFGYFAEDKLQTYLFDNHHADAIFFDGLIENKKTGLFDYKQRHYKKTIKYKLIDICDYEYK